MNPRGSVKGLDVVAIARSGMESAPLAEAQRSAFARVYEEHAQAIYRYLLARVGRGDLAEELTFLARAAGLSTFRGTGTHLAWLIGIARRKAVDEHRQHRRERRLADASSVASSDSDSPDRVVLGRLASERVLLLLQRSTPERREAGLSREDLTKIAGSLVAIPR